MRNAARPLPIAAALNASYEPRAVEAAVRRLAGYLQPALPALVKRGDRVLVKVNLGPPGGRRPEDRFTSHPAYVEAIIKVLLDCGARVYFGDDVDRTGRHCQTIWKTTGAWDVARRTGATLVDFAAYGARERRGKLLFPRHYLVSNAYLESDVVINAANCRSHAQLVLSGAVKNMFGVIVGLRKARILHLHRGNPGGFARALADIHGVVPADLSFLDMTTMVEGHGSRPGVAPVGLLLAGADPVGLDALAAEAAGYARFRVWTTYWAERLGLGSSRLDPERLRGLAWEELPRRRLHPPLMWDGRKPRLGARLANLADHTVFRPRPVIDPEKCTACGDCLPRCPVRCIERDTEGKFSIDLGSCADCGVCLKVCEDSAVALEFPAFPKWLRKVGGRPTEAFLPTERPTL